MSGDIQQDESNLKIRADQSEQLLKELWKEYDELTKLFEEKRSRALADRLQHENKILLQEIEAKKRELIDLEQQHKVPQILISSNSEVLAAKQSICNGNIPKATTDSSATVEVPKAPAEAPAKDEKHKEKSTKKPPKQAKTASNTASQQAPVDVSRLDFRVGRIITAKKHPDADTLYVEDMDLGEGKTRTVVSGLVKSVPLDQMQNRMAVVLCNLKPVKMRGVTSEAMVMCGVTPEKTEILNPPEGAVPGDLVEFEGYPRNPDAVLNSKHKVFEIVQPDLKVDSNGTATYKGIPWMVTGKGMVVAPTVKDAIIK